MQRYIRCRGKNRNLDKLNRGKDAKEKKIKKNYNSEQDELDYFPESVANNIKVQESRSTTKPCVVRFEFKTNYNRDKGGNVAYCLINKLNVEDSIRPATKEIFEKYTQLTTLNTADEDSFDIYIMSGEAVAPYEFYANQIVKYLQKWFQLTLKTIVIDFMKDERGIIYFMGVKAFDLLKEIEEDGNKLAPTAQFKRDNFKKFYKTWNCRLCMLPYPRNKITKTVTFKLLYKLKENLKKRGFNYFEHINNNMYSDSQTCRVCDLCYALLVTEQELMEMQRTMALCNNIEGQNEETLNEKNTIPEGLVKAPQKYKTLTQWRIMFYFLKFYFMDYVKFPFEDGSQLPQKATPQERRQGKTNYKLYITIFNQKIGIPIFTEIKQFINKSEVELNTSKIFYFFTSETSSIKPILKNEEVDFRIILNEKYNEPLAECKTTLFSSYEDGFKSKPMTAKKILNFFSDYIKHFKCQLYVGLKNDGIVQTDNLQMFCYKLPNPIFITELNYYSYHTLPNDWYELFLPPGTNIQEDNTVNIYEIEKKIDEIILSLEGKEKKKKINEDEIYDPYDLLVQVQNKNEIINKIESIPIVLDKNFIEMKKEEKKERPQTSKLKAMFNIEQKKIPGKKSTSGLFYIDEEVKLKRIKEEENRKKMMKYKIDEIKKKVKERNDVILRGNKRLVSNRLINRDRNKKYTIGSKLSSNKI